MNQHRESDWLLITLAIILAMFATVLMCTSCTTCRQPGPDDGTGEITTMRCLDHDDV